MGLFSGFNPVKAITRAVGIPDKYSVPLQYAFAPFTVPTSLAFQGAAKLLASRNVPSQGAQQLHGQGEQPGSFYYMQPYPYSGGGYGGGYANTGDYGQPITPYYEGGQQWGSSIPSTTYLVQPSPTYQAYSPPTAGGDRIWEDLILGSSLFL